MRTPLAVLKGYLALLRDGSLPDMDGAIRAMEAKAEELDGLAQVLVMAARSESGEMPHQPSVFDVAEAVADAIQSIDPRARLEHAEVEVYPAQRPLWVIADRHHVSLILTNLLNNALTYSLSPARLAIDIRDTSPVEIAVQDAGVGIPLEWHGRIFERFSRFMEHSAQRTSGLGLGLSISRYLAKLNGGELILERSAPDEGSVFVLCLPATTR